MMNERASRGFTLIELVMVIAITGIIAVSLVVFFTPAVDSYFHTQRRATLTDMADTALRRMRRDIQRAVPNSIRSPDRNCFELVPISAGGRVRMGPDTVNVNGATSSAWLDTSQNLTQLDVLSTFTTAPVQGDWIVIGNQNGNDVYGDLAAAATTRVQINAAPAAPADPAFGTIRLPFGSKAFPAGYDGGRISIVANNGGLPSVFYVCSQAVPDGTGTNGAGTLYRLARAFISTYPSSCPDMTAPANLANAAILATQVSNCNFIYSPTVGNTQQSGYVWMQLDLMQSGETVSLSFGAHVDNVP